MPPLLSATECYLGEIFLGYELRVINDPETYIVPVCQEITPGIRIANFIDPKTKKGIDPFEITRKPCAIEALNF